MILNLLTKKAIFPGTGLAVILVMSAKLVSACVLVECSNGTEANLCTIAENSIIAQKYFNYSVAIFITSLLICFLRKGKGVVAPAVCLIAITLPAFVHYLNGGEECDFFTTKIIRGLFYFSVAAFTFQIISWISQKKTSVKLK